MDILIWVLLGLVVIWMYKHWRLNDHLSYEIFKLQAKTAYLKAELERETQYRHKGDELNTQDIVRVDAALATVERENHISHKMIDERLNNAEGNLKEIFRVANVQPWYSISKPSQD